MKAADPLLVFVRLELPYIEHVVDRLWERGIEEAMIFGVTDMDGLRSYAMNRLHDKYCYAALSGGGEPVAIFGAYPVDEGVYQTWFMATDGFEQHFMALTRRLRKLIEIGCRQEGCDEIWTYSALIHPRAARWFRLLGLAEDPDYTDCQIRRFKRTFERRVASCV